MKVLAMPKIQRCCIRNCDSYKQTGVKSIVYFKFPLDDILLLKKWLRQINRSNWQPSETSLICSAHFREEDLRGEMNKNCPLPLPAAVPTIFHRKTSRERRIGEKLSELKNDGSKLSPVKIDGFEPHRNKVSLLRRRPAASAIRENRNSKIDSKLRNILTKRNAVNGAKLVPSDGSNGNKPFLRITINKKINVPTSSKPIPFETIFLPYHEESEIVPKIVQVENEPCVIQNNPNSIRNCFSIPDHSAYSKSGTSGFGKTQSKPPLRQYTNKLKSKSNSSLQINKQRDVGSVSQDHIYSCPPSTVKIQSLNSKSRKESDALKKRLEELRERRKLEQLKIVRLQMHLIELEKIMKGDNHEEIVLPNLGKGNKPAVIKFSWLLREKEEYEKLLKDVREIKLKLLRERHNHELEKVRKLQIQMSNLRKKMRENDEKEIAISNVRGTENSVIGRPDWMKREEEEYEKLLQDVREIKRSYKLRNTNERDPVDTDSAKLFKCEKVLSTEDCTLIERMQEKSRLTGEIENGNNLTNNINTGYNLIDDKNEYGEVIGEIDEDSIDIDMSKESTMLNFNEEFSDAGLLLES